MSLSEAEWERLYRTSAAGVERAVVVICRDREAARDIAQEAFIRVYQRRDRIEPPGTGYVYKVATRLAVAYSRRHYREHPVDELPEVPPRGRPLDDAAARDLDLAAAIGALGDRLAPIVVLHYYCDLPVKRVARELGLETGTVKAYLHEARRKLHALLPGWDGRR